MRNIFKASVLAAALAATPLLSAANQSTPNQDEMAPLQYLIGTWHCEWKSGTNSGSEQQVFAPALDGAWLEEEEVIDRDGQASVRSIHYTGYDPATKMFVHVGPDADGTYELAQSPDAVSWRSGDGSFVHRKVSDTKRTMNEVDNGRTTLSMVCTKM